MAKAFTTRTPHETAAALGHRRRTLGRLQENKGLPETDDARDQMQLVAVARNQHFRQL
ncbi:MAG TPA: hypothetical protein VKC35_05510 [Vicinamibacterales bacterium]|nr:hypothetical protein [Vicinamibacterales bacterium]